MKIAVKMIQDTEEGNQLLKIKTKLNTYELRISQQRKTIPTRCAAPIRFQGNGSREWFQLPNSCATLIRNILFNVS